MTQRARFRLRAATALFAALVAPALVVAQDQAGHAAEEAAGHAAEAPPNPADFQLAPFITALVLFGIVLWILNKYAWPPLVQALQKREEKIRRELEDAEQARVQAQSALEQYERALAQAREEAQRLLDEAREQQQKIAADVKAQTERDIAQLRDSAHRDIEAAKRAAVAEIYGQMAETATQIASRILEREISPEDQRRLVEESLTRLEAASS